MTVCTWEMKDIDYVKWILSLDNGDSDDVTSIGWGQW